MSDAAISAHVRRLLEDFGDWSEHGESVIAAEVHRQCDARRVGAARQAWALEQGEREAAQARGRASGVLADSDGRGCAGLGREPRIRAGAAPARRRCSTEECRAMTHRTTVRRVWPPEDRSQRATDPAETFSGAELAHEAMVIARAPGGVLEAIPTWPHLPRLTLRTVGPRGPGGASSGGAGAVPLMPHHVVQLPPELVEE